MYYNPKEEPEVNRIINGLISNIPTIGPAALHNAIQLHASMELGIKTRIMRIKGNKMRKRREFFGTQTRDVIYIRDPDLECSK